MTAWKLSDAAAIAAANPYTFFKSTPAEIAQVRPGDAVKLIFLILSDDPDAPNAERMWVEVDRVDPDGRFSGTLNNRPEWIASLAPGDRIDFDASHIINTPYDDDDNLVERHIKRCYVTHRVLRDGAKVGYLYREAPDNDDDSGWRFTANDESDDYMNTAGNFAFVSVGLVLSKDDAFIHLLDAPEGSAFVWSQCAGSFIVAT